MSTHVWIRWRDKPIIGFRFGRTRGLFSERYQGTRGIPKRFFYLFGGRLTIIKPGRNLVPQVSPREGTQS